ncbi:MAG: MBL fold metallo-hydrolase [Oscillospiraceae bacterium]|nr:MBL fold metallo-hydrolase [Oscillospiraceae bacterium]
MKKMFTAVLTALALTLTGCSGAGTAVTSTTEEVTLAADTPVTPLTVTFLKVGKADAAIIQTAEHTVVIDCGEKSDGKKVVARLQEYGVETVDYLILSHYDQDHIGGAPKVIENFNIGHVVGARQEEESKRYSQLTEALNAKEMTLELPASPTSFTLDDAVFTLYPHKSNDYSDGYDNNCTLAVKVTHHGETLLFTGDAMQERLAEMMDIGDCDLMKVPYHGREIANLSAFLDVTKPEYAVISTDEENISQTTVTALQAVGAETYITYQTGNIIAVSDGSSIQMTTEGIKTEETT